MKRSVPYLLAVSVLAFLASSRAIAADDAKTKPAIDAATAWLEIVDAKDYSRSWDEAASYFQSNVSREDWVKMAGAVRNPLGAKVSRKLQSASYVTSLPGAPDGEYVVVQFASNFEGKKSVTETITPMKDKDGRWRVSGYFLK